MNNQQNVSHCQEFVRTVEKKTFKPDCVPIKCKNICKVLFYSQSHRGLLTWLMWKGKQKRIRSKVLLCTRTLESWTEVLTASTCSGHKLIGPCSVYTAGSLCSIPHVTLRRSMFRSVPYHELNVTAHDKELVLHGQLPVQVQQNEGHPRETHGGAGQDAAPQGTVEGRLLHSCRHLLQQRVGSETDIRG